MGLSLRRVLAFIALLILWGCLFASWREDLNLLTRTEDQEQREKLIASILRENPKWQEVYDALKEITFEKVDYQDTFILDSNLCLDGKKRPWVLYVPKGYDPRRPTPLLVVLHGGVSRKKLIEDPLKYAEENTFTRLAKKEGWFLIFPFGQEGATWWDRVGMQNIKDLIRKVKGQYNIDDNRVWMGGFSDGGSASFLFAMVDPTDFGAFIALNGHMGVGNLDGGIPTYAPNFFNTPVFAVTTFDDPLYPSKRMRPAIEMAIKAGGRIFYKELPGRHEFSYATEELPRIAQFLKTHPRNPLPMKIIWEAADSQYGYIKWLAIDEIRPEPPKPWHKDYNVTLVDDRITIGFYPDYQYDGKGVRVDGLAEGETLAKKMGLKEGDVIVKADGMKIDSMEDLVAWKRTVKRGDTVVFEVLRGKEKIKLKGRLPKPELYYVFKREKPSAKANALYYANTFELEASRLGVFRVFVHPDMVNLEEPIVIKINGKVVFEKKIKPDLEFMLRNFLENRDRGLIFVSSVRIELSS
jgi:predicted esterase